MTRRRMDETIQMLTGIGLIVVSLSLLGAYLVYALIHDGYINF